MLGDLRLVLPNILLAVILIIVVKLFRMKFPLHCCSLLTKSISTQKMLFFCHSIFFFIDQRLS